MPVRPALRAIPTLAGGVIALVTVAVLAEWRTSAVLSPSTMLASTAVCFLALALALALADRHGPRWLAATAATVVLAGGLVTPRRACLRLGSRHRPASRAHVGADRGRLRPPRAALLLLDVETARGFSLAEPLVLAAAAVGRLTFVNHAFEGESAERSMSTETGALFIVITAGILAARPTRGWMRTLTGTGIGAMTARRLLPRST